MNIIIHRQSTIVLQANSLNSMHFAAYELHTIHTIFNEVHEFTLDSITMEASNVRREYPADSPETTRLVVILIIDDPRFASQSTLCHCLNFELPTVWCLNSLRRRYTV